MMIMSLVVAVALAASAADAPLEPGDTAPDFTAAATLGDSVSLADYRGGKRVVLAFFPKAFTGG